MGERLQGARMIEIQQLVAVVFALAVVLVFAMVLWSGSHSR